MVRWSMIMAATPEGIIGDDKGLLWNIPEDMKHFRERTTGQIVIMGRKTYETIGRPLPNRINIVLSKNPPSTTTNPNTVLFTTLADLDTVLLVLGSGKDVYIIGGKEIYELFLHDERITRIYLTTVYWCLEPEDERKKDKLVSFSPEFIPELHKIFGRETWIQPETINYNGTKYNIKMLEL